MSDISLELQAQVTNAIKNNQPLTIKGGGSKLFMGRETDKSLQILDVSGHSGIVNYEPVELILTARAGTPLIEIENALAENNQMLAFEPPHFSNSATLGGTLACNQSGPGRPWYGSIRDHVLGIRLINGTGKHLRFGGQVMKNVAGYDVSRLQAGAMGTLGVITEVSLKILPKPKAQVTLTWELSAADALQKMNRLAGTSKPLTAACWVNGRLYVRLSGAQSAVDATATQWKGNELEQIGSFWMQLREHSLACFDPSLPLWRFSINSAAKLNHIDDHSIIDWGGSQRWFSGHAEKKEMQQLAIKAGGQVSLFSGGDREDVMHEPQSALKALQKNIKKSFDPTGIFNPGRVYKWM